jgi:BirA family transcriptional regulator, biotin operon repressor / biotin---[acetyl-CoA-carboxylase] ligase
MSDPRASFSAQESRAASWWPPVWRLERVPETASTNDDLVAAARAGTAHGAVRVTDHQTAGRGRLERRWEAPPGTSLLVSLLLPPPPGGGRLHRLTQAVGLAAIEAAESVSGVRPTLTWPNDLYAQGRKLGGILAEGVRDDGAIVAVVVGMGMNLNWPEDVPAHLADRLVSLNWLAGHPIDRDALLARLLEVLAARRWETLTADYRACLATIGQRVDVTAGDRHFDALAVDVTAEGELVVEHDDGRREALSAADVTLLR